MGLRFYVFADSYPCEAVLAAARHKGIRYERVEIPPVVHAPVMRVMFGERTVPGAQIDGRKVHRTSAIFHALDEMVPEPRLFPADPDHRTLVEQAETWGAGPFQDIGRRLVWFHMRGRPEVVRRWAEVDAHTVSRTTKRMFARPMAEIAAMANEATAERVEDDLAALPGHLDRVDALIADRVIGDPSAPNAADFQILSSVAAWWLIADLRPVLAGRSSVASALRLFPRFLERPAIPGGVMPDAWLEPLRARRHAAAVSGTPAG